jgi:hypothetical protein
MEGTVRLTMASERVRSSSAAAAADDDDEDDDDDEGEEGDFLGVVGGVQFCLKSDNNNRRSTQNVHLDSSSNLTR